MEREHASLLHPPACQWIRFANAFMKAMKSQYRLLRGNIKKSSHQNNVLQRDGIVTETRMSHSQENQTIAFRPAKSHQQPIIEK